ncbi:hypothetical protein [Marinicella meishanensis]|uniref:hypothetical protein n=1 Tax=Marinicella meishanensis TaxID=2873263 RepID=UPI001CC05FE5|nr:hypothetical protein [Marinicella sp. NBU2979]
MNFEAGNHSITINQESHDTSGSNDHLKRYSKQHQLAPNYQPSVIYGVELDGRFDCLIFAAGGATGVSQQSAMIHQTSLFVGIGDQLVGLSLPDLQLLWHKQVDEATCFDIYLSPDEMGLLVHGEMAVSKVSFTGKLIWSFSGKDILTEGLAVHESHIEVIDFNQEPYQLDIKNGALIQG